MHFGWWDVLVGKKKPITGAQPDSLWPSDEPEQSSALDDIFTRRPNA